VHAPQPADVMLKHLCVAMENNHRIKHKLQLRRFQLAEVRERQA
jgi:hypothetical protein